VPSGLLQQDKSLAALRDMLEAGSHDVRFADDDSLDALSDARGGRPGTKRRGGRSRAERLERAGDVIRDAVAEMLCGGAVRHPHLMVGGQAVHIVRAECTPCMRACDITWALPDGRGGLDAPTHAEARIERALGRVVGRLRRLLPQHARGRFVNARTPQLRFTREVQSDAARQDDQIRAMLRQVEEGINPELRGLAAVERIDWTEQ
jgi:hypothetical protein